MKKIVKIYIHTNNKQTFDLVAPFSKICKSNLNDPTKNRYNKWNIIAKDFISIVDNIESCDYILYEKGADDLNYLIEQCVIFNKKILILYNSDDDGFIDVNATILRTSFYKSSQKINEYALPAFVEDFVEEYFDNQIPIKNKTKIPKIGFCGYPNSPIRQDVIKHLINKEISNFIIRDQFWGGAINEHGKLTSKTNSVRKDFVNNIVESDYILCVRGAGNFSYRFYEAMSSGKIPLFINTDCVLPFDDIIDWKDVVVWVEPYQIHDLENNIINFHNSISEEDFIKKQLKCREIWENYLTPQGYYSKIFEYIAKP